MKTLSFFIVAFSLSVQVLSATNPAIKSFLEDQLDLREKLLSSATLLNVPGDSFFFQKEGSFSLQVGLGQVIAPFFFRKGNEGQITDENTKGDYGHIYEALTLYHVSLVGRLSSELCLAADGAFGYHLKLDSQTQSLLVAGGWLLWKMAPSSIGFFGYSGLLGVHYSNAATFRLIADGDVDTNASSSTMSQFTTSASLWTGSTGIRLQKTVLFLNFSTEIVYSLFGGPRGSVWGDSGLYSAARTSLGHGLSIQGSLEVDLGNAKLTSGAGKDVLQHTYLAHCGLKIEI